MTRNGKHPGDEKPTRFRKDGEPRKSRATKEELDDAVRLASYLLSRLATKWEIRLLMAKQYGYGKDAIDRILIRAKRRLREDPGMSPAEMRGQVVGYLSSVLRDDERTFAEQMEAIREYNRLFGLYAPRGAVAIQMNKARRQVQGRGPAAGSA
jgi:hypothetical protein